MSIVKANSNETPSYPMEAPQRTHSEANTMPEAYSNPYSNGVGFPPTMGFWVPVGYMQDPYQGAVASNEMDMNNYQFAMNQPWCLMKPHNGPGYYVPLPQSMQEYSMDRAGTASGGFIGSGGVNILPNGTPALDPSMYHIGTNGNLYARGSGVPGMIDKDYYMSITSGMEEMIPPPPPSKDAPSHSTSTYWKRHNTSKPKRSNTTHTKAKSEASSPPSTYNNTTNNNTTSKNEFNNDNSKDTTSSSLETGISSQEVTEIDSPTDDSQSSQPNRMNPKENNQNTSSSNNTPQTSTHETSPPNNIKQQHTPRYSENEKRDYIEIPSHNIQHDTTTFSQPMPPMHYRHIPNSQHANPYFQTPAPFYRTTINTINNPPPINHLQVNAQLRQNDQTTEHLKHNNNSKKPANLPLSLIQRFSKTKLCVHNLEGNCTRGLECPFAHSEDEIRQPPNLYKTKLCEFYKEGHCPYSLKCRYAHNERELRSTPEFYKTSICSLFESGDCPQKNNCRFAHGIQELRVRPTTPPQTPLSASTDQRPTMITYPSSVSSFNYNPQFVNDRLSNNDYIKIMQKQNYNCKPKYNQPIQAPQPINLPHTSNATFQEAMSFY